MRSIDVEIAVANLIGWREHVIVPNVYWGLNLRHECDLLVMDKQNRLTEIEIKVSKQDLKADFKKGHQHMSGIISRLVYAVPQELIPVAKELVPYRCGIITVKTTYDPRFKNSIPAYHAEWFRRCKHNDKRPSEKDVNALQRLGCMRIWSLKTHLRTITKPREFGQ